MNPRIRAAARRLAIRRLLARRTISSQQELIAALGQRGHDVTQTTVSRDLAALGAVKEVTTDGAAYALPSASESGPSESKLARRMRQFVLEINGSGNLVVLKTPPGAAHSVAVALDAAGRGLPDVLGTIAGDDTIFVATRKPAGGRAVARALEKLMENQR